MKSYQMAWCSVIRKPVKSILLLLVVCTISLFLLSAVASKSAGIAIQDKTRQAIGAGLRLEANETNRHKRLEEICNRIGDKEGVLDGVHQEKLDGNTTFVWTENSFETLIKEDVKKLASAPGITDYNITTVITPVNPVNFKRIEDPDTDQTSDKQAVSLIGNLDMSMDSNVLSGNVTIKDGRIVTKQHTDVCVISEELAAQDGLRVGDKLQFNSYRDIENSTVYEAEIIGIYQTKQKMTPIMSGDTYRSENTIYTDLRFPEKAEGNKNDPLYQYAYFKVGDVNQYDSVKESIRDMDVDWERYDLIDNNGNLNTMSSNFNDLKRMSEILILIVSGAGFVILSLIFVFWIKNRTQEVGILLSLGLSKMRIIGQIFLEAVMIGVIAFSLSFPAAGAVSEAAAGYLVTQQEQQAEAKKDSDIGKVASEYMEPELAVTGVEVDITAQMIVIDGIGITLLIALSVLTAGIIILRKNPKDILSEIS